MLQILILWEQNWHTQVTGGKLGNFAFSTGYENSVWPDTGSCCHIVVRHMKNDNILNWWGHSCEVWMRLSSKINTVSNEMQPVKGNILGRIESEKQPLKGWMQYSLLDGFWGCYYETGLPPMFAAHEEWLLEYHKCFWLHVSINMEWVWERERTRSWEAMQKKPQRTVVSLTEGGNTNRCTWCHLLMASDTTTIHICAAGAWWWALKSLFKSWDNLWSPRTNKEWLN